MPMVANMRRIDLIAKELDARILDTVEQVCRT
jgi:hypothetical protein